MAKPTPALLPGESHGEGARWAAVLKAMKSRTRLATLLQAFSAAGAGWAYLFLSHGHRLQGLLGADNVFICFCFSSRKFVKMVTRPKAKVITLMNLENKRAASFRYQMIQHFLRGFSVVRWGAGMTQTLDAGNSPSRLDCSASVLTQGSAWGPHHSPVQVALFPEAHEVWPDVASADPGPALQSGLGPREQTLARGYQLSQGGGADSARAPRCTPGRIHITSADPVGRDRPFQGQEYQWTTKLLYLQGFMQEPFPLWSPTDLRTAQTGWGQEAPSAGLAGLPDSQAGPGVSASVRHMQARPLPFQ